MRYQKIDSKISEVVLKKLSDFDPSLLEEYNQLDKKNGIILSVMMDNLQAPYTHSGEYKGYNLQNFVEGRQFFHSQYDFQPYPPDTYLSENMRFVKSKLGDYELELHHNYTLLKEMNLEEYLTFLEKRSKQIKCNHRKQEMINDYLLKFTKFPNRDKYKLFSVAGRNEFLAKSFYLFGILPNYFVRVV